MVITFTITEVVQSINPTVRSGDLGEGRRRSLSGVRMQPTQWFAISTNVERAA